MRLRRADLVADLRFIESALEKCQRVAGDEPPELVVEQILSGELTATIVEHDQGQGLMVWRMLPGKVLLLTEMWAPGISMANTVPVLEALLFANRTNRCKFYSSRRGWKRIINRDPRAKATDLYEVEIDLTEVDHGR